MLCTNLVSIAIQANVTALLIGEPGVGKTDILSQIVAEIREKVYKGEDFPFVVQNLAQIMAEDIGGAQVPNHEEKVMESYAMGVIKELIRARRGVYFGDEYGSSNSQVRAAFLNVSEGRRFGDVVLKGVSVVYAMNPADIAVNGSAMLAPESNRPLHIQWKLEDKDWHDFLLGGKGAVKHVPVLPPDWEATHLAKARFLISAFTKRHPKYVHVLPTPDKAHLPWPSKRSWTSAARMLAATLAAGFDLHSDEVAASVTGFVGDGVGAEFFQWVKDMDLPDPEDLLKDPKAAQALIPERHDRAIACLESVAAAATEAGHKDLLDRWTRAWEVLTPVIHNKQDRAMSAAVLLAEKCPNGATFPEVASVVLKHRRAMGVSRSKAGL